MKFMKTKIMTSDNKIVLEIEKLKICTYLEYTIKLSKENEPAEIFRCIRLNRDATEKISHVLKNKNIPINQIDAGSQY